MLKRTAALLALILGIVVAPSLTASAGPAGSWCVDHSRITVLGSSSAAGVGSTGYNGNGPYAPTRNGWWSRVSRNTQAAWQTQGTNNAMGGAVTADFLPGGRWPSTTGAVEQIRTERPSLVIIALGNNEYLNQINPATYEANLRALVTNIREARPGVDVLILQSWRPAKANPTYTFDKYGAAAFHVASSMGAGLYDLRQHMDPADTDAAGIYAPDKIHPNDAGHSIIASAVWSYLVASVC